MKLKDVLKNIEKSTGAKDATKSVSARVHDYLDTGIMSVNRILSGTLDKGFPIGRCSTLFGENSTGKSFLVANTIIQAFKKDQIDVCYYFDTEGGMLYDYMESHGVDMTKIIHIPAESIEKLSVKMLNVYDTLVEAYKEWEEDPDNNDKPRALCVIDSLGASSADKLITDAVKKEQMVQDMGLKQKLANQLFRGLQMRVAMSQCTLLVITHAYKNPGQMFPNKVQDMHGGEGLKYASEVILQCEKVLVKAADDEFLTGNESDSDDTGFYKGNKMKFFTVKTRLIKPFKQAVVYTDFNHGVAKWDGLIEDAVKFGFLEEVRGGYTCPTWNEGKRITYRELVSNDQIWNTFLSEFNEKSLKILAYQNPTSDELDKIEKEIEQDPMI